jgi:hypothetical protein
MKWLQPISMFLFSMFLILILGTASCAQKDVESSSVAQSTRIAAPISPISSPIAPVSPLPVPVPQVQPTLPAELTGPLTEFTVNNGIRADFVSLPFYRLLTWTGVTWDGGDYIWIVNNELQAIAGFNIEKATSDRLVSFPFDLEQTPSVTGLAWDGSNFFVSDVANEMIYQIDPITGKRLQGFTYDGTPNGLAWTGDGLWVVSKDRLAIEKVTVSGKRQLSLAIQGTWPTGLAWDGRYLWYSDAHEGTISILNPLTGKSKSLDEIKFMANPGTFNGLAWMNGYLWIATEGDERLHRFDVSQLDWEALDAALQ